MNVFQISLPNNLKKVLRQHFKQCLSVKGVASSLLRWVRLGVSKVTAAALSKAASSEAPARALSSAAARSLDAARSLRPCPGSNAPRDVRPKGRS